MLVLSFTDLDECAENDACAVNEVCVNTVGSYTCSCAPGYSGEAGSCQGNCISLFFLFACNSPLQSRDCLNTLQGKLRVIGAVWKMVSSDVVNRR